MNKNTKLKMLGLSNIVSISVKHEIVIGIYIYIYIYNTMTFLN